MSSLRGWKKTWSFLMSLFVFRLFYMRSTFAGTELDFRLKLTRRTKNNPPQEMGREGGGRERGQSREKEWWWERKNKGEWNGSRKIDWQKGVHGNRKIMTWRQTILCVNLVAFLFPVVAPFDLQSVNWYICSNAQEADKYSFLKRYFGFKSQNT